MSLLISSISIHIQLVCFKVNTNAEALKKTFLELTELKHILKQTQQFFDEVFTAFK